MESRVYGPRTPRKLRFEDEVSSGTVGRNRDRETGNPTWLADRSSYPSLRIPRLGPQVPRSRTFCQGLRDETGLNPETGFHHSRTEVPLQESFDGKGTLIHQMTLRWVSSKPVLRYLSGGRSSPLRSRLGGTGTTRTGSRSKRWTRGPTSCRVRPGSFGGFLRSGQMSTTGPCIRTLPVTTPHNGPSDTRVRQIVGRNP